MRSLLSLFFHLLYHQFAWTYDFVATSVSLGRWQGWALQAQPFLRGRVLEIGFGPGHLQVALNQAGLAAFGLDESRQMSRQAACRLRRAKLSCPPRSRLCAKLALPRRRIRLRGGHLPLGIYLRSPDTGGNPARARPAGQLVIVPSAWITGKGLLERLAAGLFAVTGQAGLLELVLPGIKRRIAASGFAVSHALVEAAGSRVLVVLGEKK